MNEQKQWLYLPDKILLCSPNNTADCYYVINGHWDFVIEKGYLKILDYHDKDPIKIGRMFYFDGDLLGNYDDYNQAIRRADILFNKGKVTWKQKSKEDLKADKYDDIPF